MKHYGDITKINGAEVPLVSQRSGIKPIWASEIEEFPIAVTKKHFPEDEHEND